MTRLFHKVIYNYTMLVRVCFLLLPDAYKDPISWPDLCTANIKNIFINFLLSPFD